MNADRPQPIRSEHINIEQPSVTLEQRNRLNGHKSCVIWMTGLSGSGKSTIAGRLMEVLFARGCQVTVLDGDNVRHGLCRDLGFSVTDRYEHLRRIAEVANLFYENGLITICSFIAPFADCRNFARSIIPDGGFFETYIRCPVDTCIERDPKGLYRKVRDGMITGFTGIDAPYEEPAHPEFLFDTDRQAADAIVDEMVRTLVIRGIIPEK